MFDLLMDRYEDEHLQRFSKPRRGNQENAPDINELRRFWRYLNDMERHNEFLTIKEHQSEQPDIPAMSWRNIIALIWDKVFNIRIGTVASLIFAVCFEVARRYFSVSLWFSLVPAVIVVACVVLIHRRHAPDTLSDVGAGALLFLMLWISGALSLYQTGPPKAPSNLTLSPRLYGDEIYFEIATTDYDKAKEFLFCISPDVQFYSVGFLEQTNAEHNLPFPDTVIRHDVHSGVANIDVKYLDFDGNESRILSFSFDIDQERVELCKQRILDLKDTWLETEKFDRSVYVQPHYSLLTDWGVYSIASITYGLNSTSPDITIDFECLYEFFMKSSLFTSTDEHFREFRLLAEKYRCVS